MIRDAVTYTEQTRRPQGVPGERDPRRCDLHRARQGRPQVVPGELDPRRSDLHQADRAS